MTSTDKEIERWIKKVDRAGSKMNKKSVRNKGAQIVKKGVKLALRSTHRRKGRPPIIIKKGVHEFHEGNLDRSLKVLNNIKTRNVTYVGPFVPRGNKVQSKVWKGTNHTGFYAHMLERGTRRGIRASHWFEKGVKASSKPARRVMAVKAIEVLRKEGRILGIA